MNSADAEDPNSFINAQRHALEYMRGFSQKIYSCRDIEEYYELVISVFIFNNLVHAQFKELYELDSSNSDEILKDLKIISDVISNDVVRSVAEERQKGLN